MSSAGLAQVALAEYPHPNRLVSPPNGEVPGEVTFSGTSRSDADASALTLPSPSPGELRKLWRTSGRSTWACRDPRATRGRLFFETTSHPEGQMDGLWSAYELL